jgi:UDP-3-O-[3-hydroxymyristoyl] N-acetylglucosamine deacetylase
VLRGGGLHSGRPSAVALTRAPGCVVWRTALGDAEPRELEVVRTDHGVRIRCSRIGLDVDSVEHLLAALAGLSIRRGVAIEVTDGEVPLVDGSALSFSNALDALDPPRDAPTHEVACAGEVRTGASTYRFEPSRSVLVSVEVDFAAPAIGLQQASWDGTKEAFLRDVAWARTFGFRREGAALVSRGRAAGVDPKAVMVLDDHGHVEPPGAPARPGEFARHKLLDLLGDTYLHGGPPLGRMRATRPGHAATHRAMAEALDRGIVRRIGTDPAHSTPGAAKAWLPW